MNFDSRLDLDYYDKILAGMAGSLGVGAFAGFLTSMPVSLSIGIGAFASIILMYHGMFRNGPDR